jgi:hypothetical protein
MALSVQEVNDAYFALAETARAHHLDWAVDQAELQVALGRIREGKVRTKEVPLHGASDYEIERMSKGRPAKFTLSDEYSPQEKLRILIQALENAVEGVWETAAAVSGFLQRNIPNLSGIKFMPEGISKDSFALENREIVARKQAVEHFRELIRELKEAI